MSIYCEACEGPVKDESDYFTLNDYGTELYFCNDRELHRWLLDDPDKTVELIFHDPELFELMTDYHGNLLFTLYDGDNERYFNSREELENWLLNHLDHAVDLIMESDLVDWRG